MPRAIIPGEEQLGLQRYCPRCRSWWPDDEAFWPPVRGQCRACDDEMAQLRRLPRLPDTDALEMECE